jgi:hypothetical protein
MGFGIGNGGMSLLEGVSVSAEITRSDVIVLKYESGIGSGCR